ncbi:MAG: type II toxin-antitoxin system RelB/DinJ family antitoxin [Lachnospiraceae bacterium]|nr:type II toxin-antitoxin system RelB/DinJ family antitoxin [Lachnospiraceae bacterium]
MDKTATLNLRVNPTVKQSAEAVLSKLGIPMSTAIDMYLNQISLTGGIPFAVTLPKAPASVNTTMMTDEEIHAKLQKGYTDAVEGNVTSAAEVFANFRENH